MSDSPIFILANPRSGSSVFRLILNSSPYSVFPPECGFIQWLYPKYKDWNSDIIDDFVVDVLNSKKMEGWDLSYANLSTYINTSNPKSFAEACFYIYQFYGLKMGKDVKVWGDKNNYYINYLDTISEIYPNAKYIWLMRNPMDICASYLKVNELSDDIPYKPKVTNDITQIFDEIKENNKKIKLFLENIDKSKKISINFEDMITKNNNTLEILSSFTDLDITECIDNFNKKTYFDEPSITMAWKGKTKEALDSNYINTYKNHKLKKEIETIYSSNSNLFSILA